MLRLVPEFRLRWRQRLPAWITLVVQVATLVGLPLPAEAANKDRSVPFPCQHRSCGCMNATDCWRSCCCFSARDRLSWTRDHGQVDPEILVEAVACEEAGDGDCQVPGEPSCCSKHETPKKSCCDKPKPAKTPKTKSPIRWAFGVSARGCQGKFGMLMADETRAAPEPWLDLSLKLGSNAVIPCIHEYFAPLPIPLDVPPPRLPSL